MHAKVLSQFEYKYSYVLHPEEQQAPQCIFQSLLLPKPVERVSIVQLKKKKLVSDINIEQQNKKTSPFNR